MVKIQVTLSWSKSQTQDSSKWIFTSNLPNYYLHLYFFVKYRIHCILLIYCDNLEIWIRSEDFTTILILNTNNLNISFFHYIKKRYEKIRISFDDHHEYHTLSIIDLIKCKDINKIKYFIITVLIYVLQNIKHELPAYHNNN